MVLPHGRQILGSSQSERPRVTSPSGRYAAATGAAAGPAGYLCRPASVRVGHCPGRPTAHVRRRWRQNRAAVDAPPTLTPTSHRRVTVLEGALLVRMGATEVIPYRVRAGRPGREPRHRLRRRELRGVVAAIEIDPNRGTVKESSVLQPTRPDHSGRPVARPRTAGGSAGRWFRPLRPRLQPWRGPLAAVMPRATTPAALRRHACALGCWRRSPSRDRE